MKKLIIFFVLIFSTVFLVSGKPGWNVVLAETKKTPEEKEVDSWGALNPNAEDFCEQAKNLLNKGKSKGATGIIPWTSEDLTARKLLDPIIWTIGKITDSIGNFVGGIFNPTPNPTIPISPSAGNDKINFNILETFKNSFVSVCLAGNSSWTQEDCEEAYKKHAELLGIQKKRISDWEKEENQSEKNIKLDKVNQAKSAAGNALDAIRQCCPPVAGGAGGGGTGGSRDGIDLPGNEDEATLPVVTIPQDPTPPAPEYQYAACDYTSPDFNKMHKCVLKENFEPGDIPCDVNQNQTAMVDPASMDQQSQQNFISKFTNWIAGLFGAEQPYVAGPIQVVYNPACYQGATPPPTGPTPPPTGPGATIPGQPVPPTPGDPGDPANPVVTTTTTTKPRDPAPQWCQIQDFFWRREKLSENINKDIYTLVGYPKGGLLEKTGIDYAIVYCEECNMTIRSLKDEKDLSRFIKDNDIFTKNLEPMIFEEKYPLYWYSYQNAGKIIQLQVENLPIGQYELTITCKSKEGEIVTKSIRLTRLPVFRWREVAPVSKND